MQWFDLAMWIRPLFLLWIAAIFAGIIWRALMPRRRARMEEHALIPLRDDRL